MSSFFDNTGDVLSVLGQDNSAQKAQLAMYAIQAAAKYLQSSNYDGAIKEFKKAIAFDATNETAQNYLGKIYLSQGKNDEAIKIFKSYAQQQPLSVNAQVNLGNAYLQNKQYADSEIAFKKAARLDPINPVADYTLGQQYLTQKRYAEAENQFKKVAVVAPRDGNVFYGLGMLYNQTGKTELAIKNLKQALTLKPNFPAANFELGIAYGAAGESDKAAEQVKILKSKDYTLSTDLSRILNKPKIVAMDTSKSGGFIELMGPGTPLWALDPSLITPNSSKEFTVDIIFSNKMDIASVINPSNWSITRANSADAGYYNSTIPINSREAKVAPIPISVVYNDVDQKATIKFRISQNAAGDAKIDPSHLVFSFSGKDALGRTMDVKANEVDGYAQKAF